MGSPHTEDAHRPLLPRRNLATGDGRSNYRLTDFDLVPRRWLRTGHTHLASSGHPPLDVGESELNRETEEWEGGAGRQEEEELLLVVEFREIVKFDHFFC